MVREVSGCVGTGILARPGGAELRADLLEKAHRPRGIVLRDVVGDSVKGRLPQSLRIQPASLGRVRPDWT